VLVKLGLRRERISLAIWVYAICITMIASFPTLASLYPDQASRDAIAGGIAGTPAFVVITGPVFSTSLGGLTAWRYGVLGAIAVSLMAILTVVRRTRADEEAGRTELLAAGVLGRFAPLASALALVWGACATIGVVVAAGAVITGQPVTGSILLGVALAAPGMVFGAVAAVTAQLVESARAATGLAGAALAIAFALRAVGDTISGAGFASWLSPIGWAQKLAPYGADRYWLLALFTAAAALGGMAAGHLQARRDVGLGVWPARLGRATNPRMRSPLALATRLQRGNLIGWSIGFLALGAMTGGMATDTGKLIGDNPKMIEIMHDIGGPGGMTDVLPASMAAIGGLLAAAYGISAVLRVTAEESAERTAPVLATAVDRRRYLAGQLLFAVAGPVWLLLVDGVVTGLLYGASSGHLGAAMRDGLSSTLVQAPASLVLVALAAALHGWVPRLTVLAWAVLGVSLLLGQLGPLLQLPRAVMDLSPFTHVPQLPSAAMDWTPVVLLAVVAAALIGLALAGFRHRDLRSA
jgi:ABC-2 type transport system permease protein